VFLNRTDDGLHCRMGGRLNDELETMWKEAVIVFCNEPCHNLPSVSEEVSPSVV
jgi:hypothetical protein